MIISGLVSETIVSRPGENIFRVQKNITEIIEIEINYFSTRYHTQLIITNTKSSGNNRQIHFYYYIIIVRRKSISVSVVLHLLYIIYKL